MNLSTVKSIAVPEGNVTALSIGGVKAWSASSGGGEPYSWEGVAYHIDKGTYKDVYAIGDMIPLDLGSEGVINMQIAAFDTDILADGSGLAAISWVAKELLVTTHQFNPRYSSGAEGTGTIGGWGKSDLRNYMNTTIKPLIPANVASLIKTVSKEQDMHDTAGAFVSQSTSDDVWIPGKYEVNGYRGYTGLFTQDNASRPKYRFGYTAFERWWLRDANAKSSTNNIANVSASGSIGGMSPNGAYGVCLGFCTGRTPT